MRSTASVRFWRQGLLPPVSAQWWLKGLFEGCGDFGSRRTGCGVAVVNGLSDFAAARSQELISFRRDLHAHPELSSQETRTTAAIVRRLQVAGLEPKVLNCSTGLVCDVGTGDVASSSAPARTSTRLPWTTNAAPITAPTSGSRTPVTTMCTTPRSCWGPELCPA